MALGSFGRLSGARARRGKGPIHGNAPSNYYGPMSSPQQTRWSRWGRSVDVTPVNERLTPGYQDWMASSPQQRALMQRGGGMVETPLGTFGANNWQQRSMFDLAGTQRGEMLSHADRLRGIAEDTAERAGGGFSESIGQEVPGLVSLLSDYLHGNFNVEDLPAFQGSADYIERATRRTNAALGYNMSGNVANAVGENLQQYSTDVYNSQVRNLIDTLGQHTQSASLFPSDIYSDLMAQASQAEAQQYDPYGNVIGYVSELATGRI